MMKIARLLPVVALLAAGVANAAPDPTARERLTAIMHEFDAIATVDIGYCDHEYPAFSKAFDALKVSQNVVAMDRLIEHFELEFASRANVEHNPSADQCFAELDKALALYERHGDYIQTLAARLPPRATTD